MVQGNRIRAAWWWSSPTRPGVIRKRSAIVSSRIATACACRCGTRRRAAHQRTPHHAARWRAPPPDGDLQRGAARRRFLCGRSPPPGGGKSGGSGRGLPGVERRGGGAEEGAHASCSLHCRAAFLGVLVLLATGLSAGPPRRAGARKSALRARRRGARRFCQRRRHLHRFAGRLRHPLRHQHAQQHHARSPTTSTSCGRKARPGSWRLWRAAPASGSCRFS